MAHLKFAWLVLEEWFSEVLGLILFDKFSSVTIWLLSVVYFEQRAGVLCKLFASSNHIFQPFNIFFWHKRIKRRESSKKKEKIHKKETKGINQQLGATLKSWFTPMLWSTPVENMFNIRHFCMKLEKNSQKLTSVLVSTSA